MFRISQTICCHCNSTCLAITGAYQNLYDLDSILVGHLIFSSLISADMASRGRYFICPTLIQLDNSVNWFHYLSMTSYKIKVPASVKDAVQWRQAAELLYSLDMRSAGYLLDAMADQILGTDTIIQEVPCSS